ncbi:MAG: hypothetical protein LBQ15_07260 [Clostridium sp.]|jgi:hypothetical protein|nr:hypothetical protein [Clostridium sp.]
MSRFTRASFVEIRIYDDPANPNTSTYSVVLPITALEGVVDQTTGDTLVQLLSRQTGSLNDHIANLNIHVTSAWKGNVEQAISELIAFSQRTDVFVTPEQKEAWDEAVQTALDALALAQNNEGDITDLGGRVLHIEDSLFNGITANPFTINFDSLTGLLVTHGIWNQTARRVEC